MRRMVGRVLESAGYQVVTADNSREVLALCAEELPELMVLDLELPDSAPSQLLSVARNHTPDLPVVLLGSWPIKNLDIVSDPLTALMEKPLDVPLLIATVRGLLLKKKSAATSQGPTRGSLLQRC